jgi:hypothetical protein
VSNPFELDPIALGHERAYGGTVVGKPETLDNFPLAEGDLLHPGVRAIVEAVRAVRRERGRVTVPAIVRHLEREPGGKLAEDCARMLADGTLPFEHDLDAVVASLRERGACRRAEALSREVQVAAKRGAWADVQRAAAALANLHAGGGHVDPICSAGEVMRRALVPKAREDRAHQIAIETSLDGVFRLGPGKWLTLGAPTNVGKTSLVRRWCRKAAHNGHATTLISVEDPEEMIGGGWLAEEAEVPATGIRDDSLNDDERARAADAIERADRLRLFTVLVRDRSLDGVLRAMRAAAALGSKLIAIDYLQAIRGDMTLRTRKERVDHNLNELIACAAQLDVAVILASQVVRPERGARSEPTMHDLKESGDIENCSTYVLIVHRDGDDDTAPIVGRVAKVKDGPGIGKRVAWERDPYTGTLKPCAPPAKAKRGGGGFGA